MSDWWQSLISVVVGGAIGLGGSALQARRVDRSESTKRSRDAAAKARDIVYEVDRTLLSRVLEGPDNPQPLENSVSYQSLLSALRAHGDLISHRELRERTAFVSRAIGLAGDLRDEFESTHSVVSNLCHHLADALSAYLRGESVPADPTWFQEYRQRYNNVNEQYAREYEEWLEAQRREGRDGDR